MVEDGQDLGDLRGATHVRRQDAAGELAPLAIVVGPAVVHPRGGHGDRPGSEGDLSGAALAVADDQGMAVGVAFGGVGLQVRRDLGLQCCQQHTAGSLPRNRVEHGSPARLVLRRFVPDDLQHGCRLLPLAASDAAAVDQAGRYAAGVTGSTIHNFRSYLSRDGWPSCTGV
jgi:hypothetical protein